MSIFAKTISAWFTKLVQQRGLQYELERYISQHNPENAADVDRLVNLWDRQKIRNYM